MRTMKNGGRTSIRICETRTALLRSAHSVLALAFVDRPAEVIIADDHARAGERSSDAERTKTKADADTRASPAVMSMEASAMEAPTVDGRMASASVTVLGHCRGGAHEGSGEKSNQNFPHQQNS